MFYSGKGKPVASYDSSLVETLINDVVRVKSKKGVQFGQQSLQ